MKKTTLRYYKMKSEKIYTKKDFLRDLESEGIYINLPNRSSYDLNFVGGFKGSYSKVQKSAYDLNSVGGLVKRVILEKEKGEVKE